ncbi:hypothetical protein Tco_0385296 [Tanacetum coccineum]
MDEMKRINIEARDYLIGRNHNSWSRAFFNLTVKCPAFENRILAMHNIDLNLEDQLTPTVKKKLKFLKREQRLWQLSEVSCIHTVAGYMHLNRDPGDGASHWVMRCSNCQGNGYNKASYDEEHVPKPPRQRKLLGRTRQAVFRSHASARGGGRGSRGGRGAIGGRSGSRRGAVGPHLMDENEIRVSMEHDYMQELLDPEEEKRQHEEREYQERKNSSINFDVFTQESVINDPTDPIDVASSQDMYKRKDVQEGVADVAASLKDNNKGKDVHEGSISKSGAQPLRK